MLPILYELPLSLGEDAWQEEKNWPLVNPNLGRSVNIEFLRNGLIQAREKGKAELALFASQHFNVEIGLKLRSDRWVGADHWLGATEEIEDLDDMLSRCEVFTAGIDGGGLDDLFSLAICGRERGNGRWLVWGKTWCHRGVLTERKEIAPKLLDFEAKGELVIVDDLEVAFEEAAKIIADAEDAYQTLDKVGLDPMGVGAVVDALARKGITNRDGEPDRVVAVSQGWTLNGAINTTGIKLANGTLKHAKQDILAWAVGNAKVEPKGNAITITKQAAGKAKIDPLMAVFDAVSLMSRNPEAKGRSVFDTMSDTDAETDGESSLSDAEWEQILRDPLHPRFFEARERWESMRPVEDEEDGARI